MSKSKRNGVDPQSLIETYGADTARFYMMFAAPPEQTLEWSDSSVEGSHRFLRRVWAFGHALSEAPSDQAPSNAISNALKNHRREIHTTLKQATHDLNKQQFNTVASGCMKMLNALEKLQKENEPEWQHVAHEGFSILLRVLSPIAPHIAQTLWKELGYGEDILTATWPEPIEAAMVQDELTLAVQVNGKLRGSITVARTADKAEIEQHAVAQPFVQKFIEEGASVRKIIIVPNKLVNIVVG